LISTEKLTLIAAALRSFSEVDQTKSGWHPTQDPLHYALIQDRWHLIHPLTEAHKLPDFQELHDTLGDMGNVMSGGLNVTGVLDRKRVPVMMAKQGRHPLVIKGMEHDNLRGLPERSGGYGELVLPGTDRTGGPAVIQKTELPTTSVAPPLKIDWGYDSAGVWGPKAVTDKPPRSVRWSEKNVPAVSLANGGLNPVIGDMRFNPDNLGSTLKPYQKQLLAGRAKWEPDPTAASTQPSAAAVAHYDENGNYLPPENARTTNGGVGSDNRWASGLLGDWDRGEMREAPEVARYITQALAGLGAPVVPYATSVPEAFGSNGHKDLNREYGTPFFRSPTQQMAVMPFISTYSSLPTASVGSSDRTLGRKFVARLSGRLSTGEKIMGAPDRHNGNYESLPMAMPDGSVVDVRHGLDYELPNQNHNRAGMHGHGVLPDRDESVDYDANDPNDHKLGELSRSLMHVAGLKNGKHYLDLSDSQKGSVDVLRSFPRVSREVRAPSHANMYTRAKAIASHLDPDSYDHNKPNSVHSPQLYHLWKLMEQQDRAEPPVNRPAFTAPVRAGQPSSTAVADEAAYDDLAATGDAQYIGGANTMRDAGTAVAREALEGGQLQTVETEYVEAALRHLGLNRGGNKPQPAVGFSEVERKRAALEADEHAYGALQQAVGWPNATSTMNNMGTSSAIANLNPFSGNPPTTLMAGALRHLKRQQDAAQAAAASDPTSTYQPTPQTSTYYPTTTAATPATTGSTGALSDLDNYIKVMGRRNWPHNLQSMINMPDADRVEALGGNTVNDQQQAMEVYGALRHVARRQKELANLASQPTLFQASPPPAAPATPVQLPFIRNWPSQTPDYSQMSKPPKGILAGMADDRKAYHKLAGPDGENLMGRNTVDAARWNSDYLAAELKVANPSVTRDDLEAALRHLRRRR
jgi:hypothetical protein